MVIIMKDKVEVLGVKFDDIGETGLIDILNEIISGEGRDNFKIITPNPEIVYAANKDESLLGMINSAGLVLKDGIGIIIAQKLKGIEAQGRLTGYDTLTKILSLANSNNNSIYIVGAKEEIVSKAVDAIKDEYQNINIMGYHNGYFSEDSKEEESIIDDIKASSPDIVVVAMGFPKQEKFMSKLKNNKLSIGCGGSLDVLSGEMKRAPQFIQKIGMEWLYRLFKEPSRIKRQVAIPKFLFKILFTKNSVRKYKEE